MHKIAVDDELREWVTREICELTGITYAAAWVVVDKAPCVCCGHKIGSKQTIIFAAVQPSEVRFCCGQCVYCLGVVGARRLLPRECREKDSPYHSGCLEYFLTLVTGVTRVSGQPMASVARLPASSSPGEAGNGARARKRKHAVQPLPPKHKEPVKRRVSPGRGLKKIWACVRRR